MNEHWRLTLVIAAAFVTTGCQSIGAGSVQRDRLGYANAIGTSWKEQTLLNIVKLRYLDTPVFLDVLLKGTLIKGRLLKGTLPNGTYLTLTN
jgi:hypothetical protein